MQCSLNPKHYGKFWRYFWPLVRPQHFDLGSKNDRSSFVIWSNLTSFRTLLFPYFLKRCRRSRVSMGGVELRPPPPERCEGGAEHFGAARVNNNVWYSHWSFMYFALWECFDRLCPPPPPPSSYLRIIAIPALSHSLCATYQLQFTKTWWYKWKSNREQRKETAI